MLPAASQAEILRLRYAERWGSSQIARHLGIHRESVRRVALRRSVALTPAPPAPRTTVLTPFHARIQALLTEEPARSAIALFQVLRAEGYRGGISALRGAVRTLRPSATPAAFVSLTFGRAEAAQVDWGEFGDVFGIGRAVHAFVLVLCYSRLLTVTFTFSQSLEAFLRCHEQAFAFLGGCPKECWYDNLATAVAERRGTLVRFHPRFLAYAGHHRFRPVACNVGRGNEKGRVEDAIKVPPHELLVGAHVPGPRRSARSGAGLARYRRQPARAPGDAEDPRPLGGGGAAAPAPAGGALRHGRGAERGGASELPNGLRWQSLLRALAPRGQAAHPPGRCRDGDAVVRDPPGGAPCPLLAARGRGGHPGPRGWAAGDQARGPGALAGRGRTGPRPGG